jgi:CxxC-x17-CxxC domain-containing protein
MKDFKKSFKVKKPFGARAPGFGPARGARPYGARQDGPIEMHQATCNECGNKCEVPFRPNGKKPIYCRDCFKGKDEQLAYGRAPGRGTDSGESADLKRQLSILNSKMDRLIEALEHQTRVLSKSK